MSLELWIKPIFEDWKNTTEMFELLLKFRALFKTEIYAYPDDMLTFIIWLWKMKILSLVGVRARAEGDGRMNFR